MSDPIAPREHVVYRFFDKNDRLLYVGCTRNLEKRCREHRSRPWFHEVTRTTTTTFPNRHDARQAERQAIGEEHPVHNVHCRIFPAMQKAVQVLLRVAPITHQQLKVHAAQRRQSMSKLVERAVGEMILRDLAARRPGRAA